MIISKKVLQAKFKELRETVYLLNRNLMSRIALIILVLLILIAIFAPILAPYPEDAGTATHPTNSLAPVSAEHIMGTDEPVSYTHLKYPTPLETIIATAYCGWIYSPEVGTDFQKGTDWFSEGREAGTGPYMIEKVVHGNEVVLTCLLYTSRCV